MFFQRILLICAVSFALSVQAAELSYYLPAEHQYSDKITKPSTVLGFNVGERHIRHDQLVDYMTVVSEQSLRIKLEDIGRTYQQRKQLLMTISSPENLQNLDQILAKRQRLETDESDPLIVWLGYSVHGDEISGANAAMLVAYHLAASEEESVKQLLNDIIIVMEPSINPDGMDRFTNWVSTFRSNADNSDPNHIEHHQGWPTGRTNHYWFDLNRDWLLLSQKESVNRLTHYHRFSPNVLGDFHEMGANSSYFFQPGIPSRKHPITPQLNVTMTSKIAEHHAKALDSIAEIYYTEENFDDFYYGKGSTYPDVNGAIGILFEQASSRGMQQETVNGLLTFEQGIRNQFLTSLSTLSGSLANKKGLNSYRNEFFISAEKEAKKEKFTGYLVQETEDHQRMSMFLDKLRRHQINAYALDSDLRVNDTIYKAKHSYFIPLKQRQYRLIKALFNQQTNFQDNTFYDVSGWTLPLAMNIETTKVERRWGLKLANQAWQPEQVELPKIGNSYAYAVEWNSYLAPKFLQQLLQNNLRVKVATKPFSTLINGKEKRLAPGTLMIASGIQDNTNWLEVLKQASQQTGIVVYPVSTGLTPSGIDVGSNSFKVIEAPKILMIGGKGVSQYEAGEVRYYLDEHLHVPVTIIEQARLSKIDFADYTHIVMVDGSYKDLPKSLVSKLLNWLRKGGVIFGQKRAAKWLADREILKASFASKSQLNQLFDADALNYRDKEKLAGRKRIAGAIFATNIDTSHPLAFGYQSSDLPIFKNSTVIMDKPKVPFATVVQYQEDSLLSGYTDKNLVNRLSHSASLVAHNVGKGRVIASADNLAFRGYWHGTAKLLANSIFFAKAFSTPTSP
ncbi:M14 family zinc carboxypeptidase [Thalassotalea euphylliae]|uniref:M14 family zinc carboxypeptidase n=1 Tax=Thalassotalea euphylliae TaxID=1655234 RepID=UPI00363037BF